MVDLIHRCDLTTGHDSICNTKEGSIEKEVIVDSSKLPRRDFAPGYFVRNGERSNGDDDGIQSYSNEHYYPAYHGASDDQCIR
jgi:hypothetical protein